MLDKCVYSSSQGRRTLWTNLCYIEPILTDLGNMNLVFQSVEGVG